MSEEEDEVEIAEAVELHDKSVDFEVEVGCDFEEEGGGVDFLLRDETEVEEEEEDDLDEEEVCDEGRVEEEEEEEVRAAVRAAVAGPGGKSASNMPVVEGPSPGRIKSTPARLHMTMPNCQTSLADNSDL
jgi:hypothetical protein